MFSPLIVVLLLAPPPGVYRSDEMDAYSASRSRTASCKCCAPSCGRPTAIDPIFKDSFRSPTGVIQFSRDAAGRVSGFQLQGGRVRQVKFWKDTSAPRSGTN